MSSNKKINELDRDIKEAMDDIDGISEDAKEQFRSKSATENFAIVLTYVSSKRLLKHSKHLTWLTIGLLFATILLFGTAIAPIICSRTG